MNIAHCVLSLEVGGLEVLVAQLAEGASSSGHNVTIICLDQIGSLGDAVQQKGINVYCVHRKGGKFDFNAFLAILKIVKRHSIDVIHSHNFEAYLYATAVKIMRKVDRHVHTQHGLVTGLNWKKRILLRVTRGIADSLCPVSISVGVHMEKLGWIGPRANFLVFNGADTQKFCPNRRVRAEQRKKYRIEHDEIVCICVARLAPVKDHASLIDGFGKFLSRHAKAKLFIVGNGPLFQDLAAMVNSKNLDNDILMLGERNDIVDLLQMSDIFVMTSLTEGISIAVLEAMAAELVPVVTDVGGNREVIDSGRNGILVEVGNPQELADSLQRLQEDPRFTSRLSEAARSKVELEFSLATTLEAYLNTYGVTETADNSTC